MDFRSPSLECLSLFAFCVASTASAAQAASPWTDIHAPTSATIEVMGKSGRGTLLAGTSYGYLFRSTDGGEHWTRTWGTRTNFPPKLIQASGDSLILAAYSYIPNPLADCFGYCTGLYRSVELLVSRDDGVTWSEQKYLGRALAVGPGPEGSLLLAGSGIYIHARGDTAWKPLAFGFSGSPRGSHYPFWTAMVSSGSRLVGIYDSILYSAEYLPGQDSVTFAKVMDTVASIYPIGNQAGNPILVSTRQGLFRCANFSSNGLIGTKVLLDTSRVSGLMEADSGYLVGRSANRLRRGKAQGGGWQAWGPELPEGVRTTVWLNQDVIAAGSGKPQFMRSVSAGAWTGFGTAVSEFPTDPLLVAGGAVFASTYQGIMSARPGGEWSRVDSLVPEKYVSFMAHGTGTFWAGGRTLWRATGDPTHAQWTVPRGLDSGFYPRYFRTTGKYILASYLAQTGAGTINALAVCPVNGDSCRTTPSDALGKAQWGTNGTYPISSFTGTGDTLFASSTLLYRSVDGGRTWDEAKSVSTNFFNYVFLGKRLFAIGYSGEGCVPGNCWEYSDDLGETWTVIANGGPENRRSMDLQEHDGAFYAATDNGVFTSRDGLVWTDLGPPGEGLSRLAAGDGLLAAGTDDTRILIRELEGVGLHQAGSVATRKAAMKRASRNGIFVKDARGTLRRMDGKAAVTISAD